jgi:hypothetical protein
MSGMKERNNEEKLAALSRTSLEEHRHPSDMLQLLEILQFHNSADRELKAQLGLE